MAGMAVHQNRRVGHPPQLVHRVRYGLDRRIGGAEHDIRPSRTEPFHLTIYGHPALTPSPMPNVAFNHENQNVRGVNI